MKIRNRVRVNVTRPDGERERILETAVSSLRSRLLTKPVGQEYAVLVLTSAGVNVDSIEVVGLAPRTREDG